VSETIHRLSSLQEGDDITHTCETVVEALRRGDEADCARNDAPIDSRHRGILHGQRHVGGLGLTERLDGARRVGDVQTQ
jgi:hypothetical protein